MLSDLILAPLVVMQRLPLVMIESVQPHSAKTESRRMVREKVAATYEGLVAANVELHRLWWHAAVLAMRGGALPGPFATTASVTRAALKPAARRVKANARRLARG